jgi:hypothetical protein
MTPETRSACLQSAPDGATLAPIRTGIVHGPERCCEIAGCDAPAMHVHGVRCGVHTFAPRLSREPLPLASRCGCPDDCNCRSPHRTNYCGCGCRAHYASRRHER